MISASVCYDEIAALAVFFFSPSPCIGKCSGLYFGPETIFISPPLFENDNFPYLTTRNFFTPIMHLFYPFSFPFLPFSAADIPPGGPYFTIYRPLGKWKGKFISVG
jgi:hypothetical protein